MTRVTGDGGRHRRVRHTQVHGQGEDVSLLLRIQATERDRGRIGTSRAICAGWGGAVRGRPRPTARPSLREQVPAPIFRPFLSAFPLPRGSPLLPASRLAPGHSVPRPPSPAGSAQGPGSLSARCFETMFQTPQDRPTPDKHCPLLPSRAESLDSGPRTGLDCVTIERRWLWLHLSIMNLESGFGLRVLLMGS